ncbi:MAG: hypothetical protein LCI00_19245 [Chloroflexi bacterium]|nr:hypothetical protein [Chloroflexota bacterium]MCC6894141.1 hypothetical protein [Anaerolineae bacterium]
MNQHSTITIPLSTADKLASLGQAMLDLSAEMKQHAAAQQPQSFTFSLPDLTLPASIAADDEWFWSEEWQQGERQANEDIKMGRVSREYTTVDDLIDAANRHV